jgi:hypothetical protein
MRANALSMFLVVGRCWLLSPVSALPRAACIGSNSTAAVNETVTHSAPDEPTEATAHAGATVTQMMMEGIIAAAPQMSNLSTIHGMTEITADVSIEEHF